MTVGIALPTAARILKQLRRDRRTVALVLLLPPLLLAVFKYVFDEQPQTFARIGPSLVGLFPFTIMFMVTSIAMLRERTGGTLERLMSMPISKIDLLIGYAIAFAVVAAVQAALTSAVGFGVLDLTTVAPVWALVGIAVGISVLGMALGLFFSAFATSEFQAVQFMPAVVLPQILLGGLFVPREQMAPVLDAVSDVLPFTYAYDAFVRVTRGEGFSNELALDIGVIVGATILSLVLGAATLRRRTP